MSTSTSRCTSILHPPDNTKTNPVVDFLSSADFSAANSTPSSLHSAREFFLFRFHRRSFRWRASVPSSNLDCGRTHSAACRCWELRHKLLDCGSGSALTQACLRFSFILPVQHRTCALARRVAQTLTVVSFQPEEWLRSGP